MMTVNEFWTRVAINAVFIVIGIVLLVAEIGLGGLLLAAGIIGIIWVAISAKRQTTRMNQVIEEKRRRN